MFLGGLTLGDDDVLEHPVINGLGIGLRVTVESHRLSDGGAHQLVLHGDHGRDCGEEKC